MARNNVAEYHGLLRGVEAAVAMGADDVDFYMDSKLGGEPMNGRWTIRAGLALTTSRSSLRTPQTPRSYWPSSATWA